jgi:AAA domain, putative AbiEii toxin, Type IV TA system/AAA ATPase domain
MHRLEIENFGPINRADITFGDLTVFVGPQATGKSLALQMLCLLVDRDHIFEILKTYGLDWSGNVTNFLNVYLGEGMGGLWHKDKTKIRWDESQVDLQEIASSLLSTVTPGKSQAELRMFYIPAQRILTLASGWPRPFSDYSAGDPFAVRHFSGILSSRMAFEFTDTILFPNSERFGIGFDELLKQSVFAGLYLCVDRRFSQKRLILEDPQSGLQLPFRVWSSGQRELTPLLLGLSWLMPRESQTKLEIKWVVIEEPEMGLHPRAISVVLLMTLELLRRGYRVALSTHSQHVLDMVWALRLLREHGADPKHMLNLFDVAESPSLLSVARSALEKTAKVYYFDPQGQTHDITSLDPGSTDSSEASWGGLGDFSGRVADVVAEVVAASERRAPE